MVRGRREETLTKCLHCARVCVHCLVEPSLQLCGLETIIPVVQMETCLEGISTLVQGHKSSELLLITKYIFPRNNDLDFLIHSFGCSQSPIWSGVGRKEQGTGSGLSVTKESGTVALTLQGDVCGMSPARPAWISLEAVLCEHLSF